MWGKVFISRRYCEEDDWYQLQTLMIEHNTANGGGRIARSKDQVVIKPVSNYFFVRLGRELSALFQFLTTLQYLALT